MMKTGWFRFLCGLVPLLGATVALALPSVPPSTTNDPNGNRTKCVYPDTNRTLLSLYDAANRLAQISDVSGITRYGYDKNGNRTGCELPNGVVTTSMFDALNRLTSMTNQLNGVTIYGAVYGNDLVGNRRSINQWGQSMGSTLNQWGRLSTLDK
jgi:YD repeat-containing protein